MPRVLRSQLQLVSWVWGTLFLLPLHSQESSLATLPFNIFIKHLFLCALLCPNCYCTNILV